jgi:hypothetical protein
MKLHNFKPHFRCDHATTNFGAHNGKQNSNTSQSERSCNTTALFTANHSITCPAEVGFNFAKTHSNITNTGDKALKK